MPIDRSTMSLDAVEAHDAWGFVGVVRLGSHEAYRTRRSYPVPSEAIAAAEQLLAHALGTLLAAQELRPPSSFPHEGDPRPLRAEPQPRTTTTEPRKEPDPA